MSEQRTRSRTPWIRVVLRFAWMCAKHPFPRRPLANIDTRKRKVVVYAAFKGMGDLLCALPVIVSELNAGRDIILLIFPQIRCFVELLDFGSNRRALRVCVLPVTKEGSGIWEFLKQMSNMSPDLVWYSPHAPLVVSSWKIPLLLWVIKHRYWPSATLAGADSEKLSWLFDERVPVDRHLPYGLREWTAFALLDGGLASPEPPALSFKQSLQRSRLLARAYDIVIHPGAGANNRKWPYSRYAELIQYIPPDLRIAVVGLPCDVEAVRAVLPPDREVLFLSGSLEDAITSIARARVALTMDSGTMFFAKVLGVPTVTLFGPSDPATVIRPDENLIQVYDVKWSCQPCGRTRCTQKSVLCMNSIDASRVGQEVLKLLQRET